MVCNGTADTVVDPAGCEVAFELRVDQLISLLKPPA